MVVSFEDVYEFNEVRISTTCEEPETTPPIKSAVIIPFVIVKSTVELSVEDDTIFNGMLDISPYVICDEPDTIPSPAVFKYLLSNSVVNCAELLITVFESNSFFIVVLIEDVNYSKLSNLPNADSDTVDS